MKVLLKIKVVTNPELGVNIGLKNTYQEFDVIEEAIGFLFKNRHQIESYEIFKIEEYKTKKESMTAFSINAGSNPTIRMNGQSSFAEFR